MKALAPLIREFKIAMYRWAEIEMGPSHKDLPEVVRRLHALRSERPPIEQRPRSRCAALPGMCAGDPNCEDHRCAGRTWGLYQRDGGMQVHGPLSFPIEQETGS